MGWVKGGQLGSVYKQPETGEDGPDTAGGCQVSRRGHNGEARGSKARGMRHVYMQMYCMCNGMIGS